MMFVLGALIIGNVAFAAHLYRQRHGDRHHKPVVWVILVFLTLGAAFAPPWEMAAIVYTPWALWQRHKGRGYAIKGTVDTAAWSAAHPVT